MPKSDGGNSRIILSYIALIFNAADDWCATIAEYQPSLCMS